VGVDSFTDAAEDKAVLASYQLSHVPEPRVSCAPPEGQRGLGLAYINPPRTRMVSGLGFNPFPRQNIEKGTAGNLVVQHGC